MSSNEYLDIQRMCIGNWDTFKELEDEIYEQIHRGAIGIDSLLESDQEFLVGMLIECLDDESKFYFITENKDALDVLNLYAISLQNKTKTPDFMEELNKLAIKHYSKFIDAIFEEIIFKLNYENHNNSNHISEGY